MKQLSMRALFTMLVVVVTIAAFAIAVVFMRGDAPMLGYWRERAVFALSPSATRAYAYGMNHFRADYPAAYNVNYAGFFFKKTIQLDPRYPLAHQQLALVDLYAGNLSYAKTRIDEEIALQGEKNPGAYYIRGVIETQLRDNAAAADDFAHFIRLSPHVWAAYQSEAWALMRLARYTDAVGVLTIALAQYPDSPWLLHAYAVALYERGRTTDAQRVAARARAYIQQLTPQDLISARMVRDPRQAPAALAAFTGAANDTLSRILNNAATSTLKIGQ